MIAFVSSVKPYSEVSSRDYLVRSDRHVCLLFGSWFRNPPKKEQKLREKFLKKVSFQVRDGQKQGRDEKTQEHYPTTK